MDWEAINEYNTTLSEQVKKDIACSVVQSFPYPYRCQFVRTAEDCVRRQAYVSYINMLFCDFSPQSALAGAFALIFLMLICWIFCLILTTTIDKIFCPALKVIAILMGMNEHLAGCTLVAFGGCSPDVLTSVFSKSGSKGLLSGVIGNSFYVCGFIAGLIIVLAPFEMQAYSSFRDVLFLLFSLLYTDHVLRSNDCITFFESSIILTIYGVYLLVLIIDQIMLKRKVRAYEHRVSTREEYDKLEKMRGEAAIELVSRTSRSSTATVYGEDRLRNSGRISVNIAETRKQDYSEVQHKNAKIFKQFIDSIKPIDVNELLSADTFGKTVMIIRAPITSILMLLLPVLDYELPRHGWSKLLNCFQMISSPIIFIVAFLDRNIDYGDSVWPMSLLFSVPFAIYVFCTTRTDIPPKYHIVFGILACTGSVTVIYICATELLQILYVLGIVTGSSTDFLSSTLLAWGMSIGDLVSNVFLALHGYQRMGHAACFGSPMFNNVFIVGGHYLLKTLRSDENCVPVPVGDLDENCVNFMMLSLVFTLLWMMLTNCHARRSVGIFIIGTYVAFFVYTLLGELSVVHSFSADTAFFDIL